MLLAASELQTPNPKSRPTAAGAHYFDILSGMTYYHIGENHGMLKIAVTIDKKTLKKLDRLVAKRQFSSRSRAVQEAVEEKLQHLERTRLARECLKLNPAAEQALAEEGMAEDLKDDRDAP
jgi:Arc/MetJ-type ribon-helix-helix transcriptional regulator